jgi:hypothetical protein
MIEQSKEETYRMILEELSQCVSEDSQHSAVVILVDEKESNVKIYGLNMDEMELPVLLLEAANEVNDKVLDILQNRTIQ